MEDKVLDIITECKLGEITTNEATRQILDLFAVSGSFSLEQMKAAFQAGKEWIWEDLEQTTTCSKWESFEEWFAEWSQNYR